MKDPYPSSLKVWLGFGQDFKCSSIRDQGSILGIGGLIYGYSLCLRVIYMLGLGFRIRVNLGYS